MAERLWPGKQYGNIPELDEQIKKNEDHTWSVKRVKKPFRNLTKARLKVAEQLGKSAEYTVEMMSSKVAFEPSSRQGAAMPARNARAARHMGRSIDASEQPSASPKVPRRAYDVFDSANRIYVRLPMGAELSFPKNVNQAQLNATIKVVRAATRKK